MKKDDLIRLHCWFGRIVDVLTSDTTGEKFARVRLAKHAPGITEVHSLDDLQPATVEQVEEALRFARGRYEAAWEEVLCPRS